MKTLNQKGFTLVELMVVVAIIGILSSVAIPNFRKYQAKAKTSEAKVQLAAAYTAEQAFFGDFGIFGTCLDYMGYDPGVLASRYYAVGFPADAQAIDDTVYAEATNAGLSAALCADDLAAADGTTWFAAGRGASGVLVDTLATAATTGTTLCDDAFGDQSAGNTTFTITALGIISTDNNNANYSDASCFTINANKLLSTVRPGY